MSPYQNFALIVYLLTVYPRLFNHQRMVGITVSSSKVSAISYTWTPFLYLFRRDQSDCASPI